MGYAGMLAAPEVVFSKGAAAAVAAGLLLYLQSELLELVEGYIQLTNEVAYATSGAPGGAATVSTALTEAESVAAATDRLTISVKAAGASVTALASLAGTEGGGSSAPSDRRAVAAKTSPPPKGAAKPPGYKAYSSHKAFKRAMGSAGADKEWHHVVEQTPGNEKQFGVYRLHNTEKRDTARERRTSGGQRALLLQEGRHHRFGHQDDQGVVEHAILRAPTRLRFTGDRESEVGRVVRKTLELLVEAFAQSVIAQNEAIARGDPKTGNKHAKQRFATFKALRARGDEGRDALATLFTHPRPDVRVFAAAYLLRYRNKEAKAVLTEAAKGQGLASFGAVETLKRWEEGTWELDPEE